MTANFMECPQCAAKLGSPILCPSCLHNRALIESAPQWQPIETAPRDGTRILAFVPPYGAMTAHTDFFNGEWRCHSCLNREAQPTHWMPLPDPPEAQS